VPRLVRGKSSIASQGEYLMTPVDSPAGNHPVRGLSKTAIWVAAARAIGAREPDPQVRNPDDLAEKLRGDPAGLDLDHAVVTGLGQTYEVAMQGIEVASTVRAMTERTRFIDAALERALARGVRQVLVLGAGFDSRAYRFRELLAGTRVFEVDRPTTSAFKRRRVDDALGGPPQNLTYVPWDVESEGLAATLARHGYDLSQPTFVIMEGVTMYVQEEAVRATFRFVAAHAPDSSIVFDIATSAMIEGFRNIDLAKLPPAVRPALERLMNMLRDEPWVFGVPLDGEKAFLDQVGLELGDLLTIGGEESVRRHLTRSDGTTMGAEAHERALAMGRAAQEHALANVPAEQREKMLETIRHQQRQNAYRIAEAFVPARPG
jgi:methyltransferase (TIGR00027 family)